MTLSAMMLYCIITISRTEHYMHNCFATTDTSTDLQHYSLCLDLLKRPTSKALKHLYLCPAGCAALYNAV